MSLREMNALLERGIKELEAELDRAKRALIRAGFEDLGGQEWKPPLGKPPTFFSVADVETERDAARYRWLRDQARAGYEEQLFVTPDGHKDYYAPNGIYGDGLDEAVDEAMNRPAAG